MAYTADVDICNLALHKVGHDSISAGELADPGNNQAALKCSILFEPTRNALMEMHPPWRFLLKKVVYDADDFKDTITGATAADPVVVTGTDISVANIIAGLGVHISGTSETGLDDLVFEAHTVVDATEKVTLYKKDRVTTVDGSGHGAVTAGSIRIAPLYGFTYAYKLPDDFVRVWKIQGETSIYKREGNYLFTDDDEIFLTYIFLDTDVSNYPGLFISTVASKLGAELAESLAEDPELKALLFQEYQINLDRANELNLIEGELKKSDKEQLKDEILKELQRTLRKRE